MPTESDLAGLSALQTEQVNPHSRQIDQVPTLELCHIINNEDATIAGAIAKCIPVIAEAIDKISDRVRNGGRVIYVGAGTSGRLGVLDASEIPPTYSAPEGQFVAIIAGGDVALRYAQEGAEDDVYAAANDLKALKLDGSVDSLIGLAASGRTPYVLSCLTYAKQHGCFTVGFACAEPSKMSLADDIDCMISAIVGPEVVTGSTRMKAGTATKLVLNMLSTGIMIKTGKTFGNMMIDLKATNLKLQQRSRNILRNLCGAKCPDADEELDALLKTSDGNVKVAMVSLSLDIPVPEAVNRLREAGGVLAKVLQEDQVARTLPRPNGTGLEYFLCIDGGGSKCAAAIISADGVTSYGEAGGCNVTDVGVQAATESIDLAIQRAVDSSPISSGKSWRTLSLSSIWVGLAGYDRPCLAAQVDQALEKLFCRQRGPRLKVTNDIELLALSALEKHKINSTMVLIAGTGSIAMSYQRSGDQLSRTSRVGGWGHIIGDDGSGFDIGRKGVRHALAALDDFNLKNYSGHQYTELDELTQRVLEYYKPESESEPGYDLLSRVLNSSLDVQSKEHIARLAKVVVELSEDNTEAKKIVSNAVQDLLNLLRPIAISGQHDVRNSVLILAGGLMQSSIFRKRLEEELEKTIPHFKAIELIKNPAIMGAQHLLLEH
ncbi:hypothetical protein LTR84_000974 [Exophiala bonariae]|uniref:N-acetyl-D-glucosamine kinase n=1 Tax=Exophiala bonariae TaxID=1690606 RepID=A0AAV9NVS4_9EURO|nr:hypothetical protein LTR84_000974 [Exophiala bonariae]